MLLAPSEEEDVMFLRPLTLTREASRIFVIVFSTASGPAFVYVVEILMKGESTSGKSPTATFLIVKSPTNPKRAKTIKNSTGWDKV